MKRPLETRNLQPIITKTKAIEELKTEIRRYQNKSQIAENELESHGTRSNSPSI